MEKLIGGSTPVGEEEPLPQCKACGRPIEVTFSVMVRQACPACGAAIEEDLRTDDIGDLVGQSPPSR